MPTVPKAPSQRLGHSHGKRDGGGKPEAIPATHKTPPPKVNPDWHPEAQSWFRSLGLSAVSKFYEPSDWSLAWTGADLLTEIVISGYRSSPLIHEWLEITKRLLCTEGDRRKARVELIRAGGKDPDEEAAEDAVTEWDGLLKVVKKELPGNRFLCFPLYADSL